MNTDAKIEVFLVWDADHVIDGIVTPQHMSVQATEEDAIAYGKEAFESDAYGDCLIERWVVGKEMPKESFHLSDKV